MAHISDITVPTHEADDPIQSWLGVPDVSRTHGLPSIVQAWLAAARKAGVRCSLTNLATTREGKVLHRDIVIHDGALYKIIVVGGMARAEAVPPGSVLPESVRLRAKAKPDERDKALNEWLTAASKASCDVAVVEAPHTARPINALAVVVHVPTGLRYLVMLVGGGGINLFAGPV